jgi:anti-sigma factor RsiW
MNHPYELLADLMDGTLDEGDLAGVQAHLDACASCREDLADAAAGARAARSLPVEDPPADMHGRVVGGAGGHGTPSWYRWAGVAAAAAAVVAIAIALPNVGSGPKEGATELAGDSAESAEIAPSAADVVVIQEDQDFDAAELEALARSATRASGPMATDAAGAEASRETSTAVRCVTQAFGNQQSGQLTQLIQARFEGEEAYIAVYLEGPGADQPPDTVAVWAASSKDCTILSFASARI